MDIKFLNKYKIIKEVTKLVDKGISQRKIANLLGIHRSTVYRYSKFSKTNSLSKSKTV